MSIEELLSIEKETEFLDYKLKIDFEHNKVDFLKDIIAFSNCGYIGDQYIIYGVKEKPGGIYIVGLDEYDYGDDADYHKLVSEKIEPHIEIEFIKYIIDNKKILVVRINADKEQRPYVAMNTYSQGKQSINIGDSWIRVGSSKRKLTRNDYEQIYGTRRSPLLIRLRDNELFVHDPGVGKLELLITNPSDFDRVFTEAFLSIESKDGNQLTVLRMIKFSSGDKIQEGSLFSDLALSIPRKADLHGIAEFPFSSTQAIIIGLTEYGDCEHEFIFRIKLRYDINKEYLYTFEHCRVFARGAVLWKVQDIAKEDKKKRKSK